MALWGAAGVFALMRRSLRRAGPWLFAHRWLWAAIVTAYCVLGAVGLSLLLPPVPRLAPTLQGAAFVGVLAFLTS
jgi:hypothetical protein